MDFVKLSKGIENAKNQEQLQTAIDAAKAAYAEQIAGLERQLKIAQNKIGQINSTLASLQDIAAIKQLEITPFPTIEDER